ncbi:MAG: F0F1 ATP synthase subunit gamma [Erysipelothrix sp.]|nr:F0F1 ATP synthase subunit gamma [Erysipelothrix sp.]
MSRSLASIAKRTKTIQTTQKITNAMKLVSMSKLQRYRSKMTKYDPIYKHVNNLPKEAYENTLPKLYLAFVPDLGLVSAYPRNLINKLDSLDKPDVYIIGTQSYDKFNSGDHCVLLSDRQSSENLDIDEIKNIVTSKIDTYNIVCLVPQVSISAKIEFIEVETSYKLSSEYDMLFEPNYETANKAFQKVYTETVIMNAYYQSKVSEYTMRRVAMEQATENADNMLYDLKLKYNRLRQEKITEEIADLTQAED